jgi:hypothetical protein
MNVALFGAFERRPFSPGWTKETLLAIFGGGEVDLAGAPPGDGARLTAIAILGGIDLYVEPGSRISFSGLSLFGDREINVTPGDGPSFRLRAIAILGGVDAKEATVIREG